MAFRIKGSHFFALAIAAGLAGWMYTGEIIRGGQGAGGERAVPIAEREAERSEELFKVRASKSGHSVKEERKATIAGIPVGRLGDPREFGDMVAFMASEKAAFLNGVALPFDGGALRALL